MKANNHLSLWSQIDQLISLPSPVTYIQNQQSACDGKAKAIMQIIGGQFHHRFWTTQENKSLLKLEIFHFEADQIPKVTQTHYFNQTKDGEWQKISGQNNFSFLHWDLEECTTQIPAF